MFKTSGKMARNRVAWKDVRNTREKRKGERFCSWLNRWMLLYDRGFKSFITFKNSNERKTLLHQLEVQLEVTVLLCSHVFATVFPVLEC